MKPKGLWIMWKSNLCSWKVISCKNESFSPVGFCSLTRPPPPPKNTILQENLYLLGNAIPRFLTGDLSACLFSLTFIKTWGEGIKTVFSISAEEEFTTLPLKVSSNRSYIILNLTWLASFFCLNAGNRKEVLKTIFKKSDVKVFGFPNVALKKKKKKKK